MSGFFSDTGFIVPKVGYFSYDVTGRMFQTNTVTEKELQKNITLYCILYISSSSSYSGQLHGD
jgi:hypothetical protein